MSNEVVVMLIRHAEKPDGALPGVDPGGHPDAHSLTMVGWQRAEHLAELFGPPAGPLRPGLVRPSTIYAAGADHGGDGKRTRETVRPLAERLGVAVRTHFAKGEEHKLVKHLAKADEPTLVCWQHGEIPGLARAFPDVSPTPPKHWPEDRYDVIWTFTRTGDGWRFEQHPQRLLPHDRPSVIS